MSPTCGAQLGPGAPLAMVPHRERHPPPATNQPTTNPEPRTTNHQPPPDTTRHHHTSPPNQPPEYPKRAVGHHFYRTNQKWCGQIELRSVAAWAATSATDELGAAVAQRAMGLRSCWTSRLGERRRPRIAAQGRLRLVCVGALIVSTCAPGHLRATRDNVDLERSPKPPPLPQGPRSRRQLAWDPR